MSATATPEEAGTPPDRRRDTHEPVRRRRRSSTRDKVTLALMLGIPAIVVLMFIWGPALASVGLSFTRWNGITAPTFIGVENYQNVTQTYPPFWPAFKNNILWLAVLLLVATPLGLLLAIVLDREIRGTRFYQSIFYLPVVLSLALVGFIWQLVYSTEQGLINNLTGSSVNWLGDPDVNIWAVLVAASWRHVGYIMVLYLAGLKGVDNSLREAAALDGAGPAQTFFKVIFPTLKPINVVVLVVTVIEGLRAFDIVYVINKGTNGLELLSVLITNNILGEASRIGFGSAIAVILLVISLIFIITYLVQTLRRDD
ncbi:carbohydrate ABC transporter permease [Kocuria sp.]|uniref:carbohydrate ABC transporter permease n=1 Tax=Kocuria sp. TaxID=1871328 RepID=UPI0026E02C49|nr:sugar ABC transporter permease [Kocuria sp.]MDO5618919.1 sugar ABC transporter permease [Kocuria sp.]